MRRAASVLSLAVTLASCASRDGEARALRVCADPNNLPFSDSSRHGFENRLVSLIGAELGKPVEYTWWAQRRGFVRNTLNAGSCDLVAGVASGMEMLVTTRRTTNRPTSSSLGAIGISTSCRSTTRGSSD